MAEAIGIDFGTTKSYVAYISRTESKERTSPIIVKFTPDNELLNSGFNNSVFRTNYQFQPVPTMLSINNSPENDHYGFHVGLRALNSAGASERSVLVSDLKDRTRRVTDRNVSAFGKDFEIEGLIGYYLWALKHYARDIRNNKNKESITITVPAQANSLQRLTMQIAARIAGYEGDVDIVEEPVAAFLFHRHMNPGAFQTKAKSHALVVDFGGGTCDVAVIQYQDDQLPIVINRSMAYLGGETIDTALLEHFWLRKTNSEFPLSKSIYDNLENNEKLIVRAHARKMKELLSDTEEIYKTSIKGVGWNDFSGNLITPIVHKKDFLRFLREHVYQDIRYGEDLNLHTSTIKGHLRSLIKCTLTNDGHFEQPIQIDNVILAGGSIQLPYIQEWVSSIIEEITRMDVPDSNILSEHNNICIACGAAIHQLYSKHSKKEWKGAIRPTLPWNIVLIHNFNREGDEKEIPLGNMGEILPIDATGYFGRSLFINPAIRPTAEKAYYAISTRYSNQNMESYQTSEKIYLSDAFGSRNASSAWANGIHVAYQIDKHGVIQDITLKAQSLFSVRPMAISVERPIVGENEGFIDLLRKLHQVFKAKSEIAQLRRRFIPRETGD